MVTNHDDSVFDHHPTTTRGFAETVNWALKDPEIRDRFLADEKAISDSSPSTEKEAA